MKMRYMLPSLFSLFGIYSSATLNASVPFKNFKTDLFNSNPLNFTPLENKFHYHVSPDCFVDENREFWGRTNDTVALEKELWKQDVSELPNAPQLCSSKSNAPWELWISNVRFNTMNNTSEKFKDYSTAGYSDYTNLSTSIQKGQTYLLNITPALSWSGYLPNVFCRVWIDWNNNTVFEDTELVFQNTNSDLFQANIRVLSSATTGNVRMRVSLKWASYPTACEIFEKGEVEDYAIEITNPPSQTGKDTLRLINVTGDTLVKQGGQVHLNVTLKNTGTAPSDPNTPLSIFQNQQPFAFKGPQSTCFQAVSNSVPIGRSLQPNETVMMPFTFTMSDSFTHISPLVYPPLTFGTTNVTIGNRGTGYCVALYSSPVIDTLLNYYAIKSILSNADLAVEILASDTTYGADGLFSFTVKMSNKGSFSIKNATTNILVSPQSNTSLVFMPQRGSVNSIFFFGTYANVWTVPRLEIGESTTVQVQMRDTFLGVRVYEFGVNAIAQSNQINDIDFNNNQSSQKFTRRISSLPDLVLSNLNVLTPSVSQGQTLNFKVDITNIGQGHATGNFKVRAYISKDNIWSADDVQDGVIPTGNFAAGFSVAQVLGASTISTSIAIGQYYLILKIDADNEILESNENNNTLVSIMPFVVVAPSPNYCLSKSQIPWELWVSKVQLNTINNPSEKFKDYSLLGYSDYTNLSTTLEKGKTYPLSITPALSWSGYLPNVYCRVWIDFNGNKILEDNEIVLQGSNINPLVSNILVPNTAVSGTVRMRIALKWGSYSTACETFEKGEVEDYSIIINGCNNVTSGGEITGDEAGCAQIGCKFCPGYGYTASIITNKIPAMGGSGNLEYIWVKSFTNIPTSVLNGITITGATEDSLVKLSDAVIDSRYLIETTYYRRFARRTGCTDYIPSNGVTKIVRPFTVPILVCPKDTIILLTGAENCYAGSLQQGSFMSSSSCDVAITGLNENRGVTNCLPMGVNMVKWTANFANGGFSQCSYSVTVKNDNLAQTCRYRDSLQLVSLFNATNGANWTNKWHLNTPIDTWQGVQLNAEGCVAYLTLENNNLDGTLPSLDMPNLGILNLRVSKLRGTIPSLNLPKLSWLMLTNSQLTGSVPNLNLPNLDVLMLYANQLTGSIPSFSLMPRLQVVLLDGNQLTGSIPNFNLPRMIHLALSYNQLTGSIPDFNFPALEKLFLDSNLLSGCIPQSMKAFCGKNVNISGNQNLSTQDFNAFCSNNIGACNNTPDMELSLIATPSVYRQWTTTHVKITLKNSGNQAFTNIKIKFPFPDKTVTGGAATPSIGKWNEWCSGGVKCYEWAIPVLTANAIATLDIPLFILDAVGNITATAELVSSTPTDDKTANNVATVILSPVVAQVQSLSLNKQKPTQWIPIVIQDIYPTLTEGDVSVVVESLIEKNVQFDFYNTLGKVIKTDIRSLEKGLNRLHFDFWNQQAGIYIIQTSEGQGRGVPLKFVKL